MKNIFILIVGTGIAIVVAWYLIVEKDSKSDEVSVSKP